MRVLLTGASGYLGRHVLQVLQQQGIETICTSHNAYIESHRNNIFKTDLLSHDGAYKLVKHAKATHLLHLAWYVNHGDYWHSQRNYEWVQASMRLIDAFCSSGGKHVTVAGTCAEYDWNYGYMKEGVTPYNPNTPYGVSKDAARRLLSSICTNYGVEFSWGHIFFPFGFEEASTRLIPSLIRVFRREIPAFGINKNAVRGLISVQDAARGFLYLLQSNAVGNYNICSGIPTQLEQVVRIIAKYFDADPDIILKLETTRPGDPPMLLGNNERLSALGWRIQQSLEHCIHETVSQKIASSPIIN